MAFSLSTTLGGEARMAADTTSIALDEPAKPVYYEESVERIEVRDKEGTLVGYDDCTSGFGYTYTTHYDSDLNYTGSDYVDSSGYRSSTIQATVKDNAGNITGYIVDSSGGDSAYSYDATDEYDADWNLLLSSYSDSHGYVSETTNAVLRDVAGVIIGYHYVSTGSNYSSESTYNADWNLLDSTYSDNNGYSSIYSLTPLYDANGKVSGYSVVSSGGGGDWGTYTSTETLDVDWSLVSSSYSSNDGYTSTYMRENEYDANGALTGYRVTSVWSNGSETYSSVNRYDTSWNMLSSDGVPYVDAEPEKLPVLSMTTDDKSEAARAELAADSDNQSSNVITGTAGHKDTLVGTQGDDVFILTDRSDRITKAGDGVDTVISSTLSLKLTSAKLGGVSNAGLTGSMDLDLAGDKHDNLLSGNAGDNVFRGGRGADTLFGGAGDDRFVLDKRCLKEADTIVDFTVGEDVIVLSGRVFRYLRDADGNVAAAWGTALRYDTDSGTLIFDSNGKKAGGEITIAIVGSVDGLDASSFTLG